MHNAVVTPLREAASYEPRKAILGIWGDTWLTRGKYGIYVAVRGSYGVYVTPFGNSTLDLVISYTDTFVKSCQILDKSFSDHHIIVCKLDVSKPRMTRITSSSRNYNVLDKETFTSRLAEALTDFPLDAFSDVQTDFFNHTVTTVLDNLCPMTKRSHRLLGFVPTLPGTPKISTKNVGFDEDWNEPRIKEIMNITVLLISSRYA